MLHKLGFFYVFRQNALEDRLIIFIELTMRLIGLLRILSKVNDNHKIEDKGERYKQLERATFQGVGTKRLNKQHVKLFPCNISRPEYQGE